MTTKAAEVDQVAVDRAIAGDRTVRLNRAARQEAVLRLHNQHCSDALIADRLGVSTRTVVRDRKDLALPEVPEDVRNTLTQETR